MRNLSTPSASLTQLSELLSTRLFKALCDPTRVALLTHIAVTGRPCSVSELGQCCPINISVVSRHLTLLRDAGILTYEKCGRQVFYSLNLQSLIQTLRAIADTLERTNQNLTEKPSPTDH